MISRKLTNSIYDEKWLKGTNIKRLDDVIDALTPIKHKCINDNCNQEWNMTPNSIQRKIRNSKNKMLCCESCVKIINIKMSIECKYKTCSKCEKRKLKNSFCDSSRYSDGKTNPCISCYRKYRKENKKSMNLKNKIRWRNDEIYRTKITLRSQFSRIVNSKDKKTSVMNLIGCTIEKFNKYIEGKFLPGMSWKNKGSWHYDHIIPCDYFKNDISKLEIQKRCFHYTNFQPLWGIDNYIKKNTLPSDFYRRKWISNDIGWILS